MLASPLMNIPPPILAHFFSHTAHDLKVLGDAVEVMDSPHNFQVRMNVKAFTPEEILVSSSGGFLTIEGERGEDFENQVTHSKGHYVSRSFCRKFPLPDDCLEDGVKCVLGHDGILKVIIPKEGKKGEKVHKVETHWGVDPGPMSKIGIHPVDHTLHMPGPLSRWHWNFWPWSHHSQPQTPSEGVKCTKEKFMVHLEVPQFYEGEISVKTLDDFLVVEGTHESRKDGQGFVSRQFKCQYLLPLNANRNELRAEMNEVGLLTVTIPRTQGSQDEKAYQISYSQAPKLKN